MPVLSHGPSQQQMPYHRYEGVHVCGCVRVMVCVCVSLGFSISTLKLSPHTSCKYNPPPYPPPSLLHIAQPSTGFRGAGI